MELTPVTYAVSIDEKTCINCGLCAAFCPVEVFEEGTPVPTVAHPELCWGCETCVGQCPQQAVRVALCRPEQGAGAGGAGAGAGADAGAGVGADAGAGAGGAGAGGAGAPAAVSAGAPAAVSASAFADASAPALAPEQRELYRSWAATLKRILGLRWEPVAISLIPSGEPLPAVPIPSERLRYCQSLMAARRGKSFMMPANRHACPDGSSILGLTEMPRKLASGELYLLFHKLDSIEAAQRMAQERPHLEPRSIQATVVTPLAEAQTEPQIVAIFAQPEQVMWILMSASYYTGQRFDLHASGYNAQCVETTLIPYLSGEPNVSFGCYGCRASSDIGDDLMFVGLPIAYLPRVVQGLEELGEQAIPQSRAKIYLPPL
jgi:uncharacterized protein (DUF169 family)/NAD-dependent dihydropyrimidine dehydrogenase PreA subunit